MSDKTLVVYFTWSGTSKKAAEWIKEELGTDIFEIKTIKKYSDKYAVCIGQAGMEKMQKTRPELVSYLDTVSEYEKIVIVSPNWWSSLPMAVAGFLERYNFTGKKIYPVCMHGGGGVAKTVTTMKNICQGAEFAQELVLNGKKIDLPETKEAVITLCEQIKKS